MVSRKSFFGKCEIMFDYRKAVKFSVILFVVLSIDWSLAFAQTDISGLAKELLPSVVTVNVFNKEGRWRGGGTGFFVKKEGILVTNFHVIDGKEKVLARLSNGEFYPVEGVLSEDRNGDLTLLALGVKEKSFPALRLTDAMIETGQPVLVIGSPSGHAGTVSKGIVTKVEEIPNFGRVFQHSAAIAKGSSGSPVLNIKGEVIGVVVGYAISEGENRNFAISVDRVKRLLSDGQTAPHDLVEWINREEEMWIGLLSSGQYEELIDYLKMRVKHSPNNAMAHFYLGLAYEKLSRSKEALEAYKKAIQFEPEDSDFYYNLGVSYIKLGQRKEAIKAFERTLRMNPRNAQAVLNIGYCFSDLHFYRDAVEYYRAAVRMKPDFAEAHYNLGEAYLKTWKKKKAIEEYEILKGLNPEMAGKLFELIYK